MSPCRPGSSSPMTPPLSLRARALVGGGLGAGGGRPSRRWPGGFGVLPPLRARPGDHGLEYAQHGRSCGATRALRRESPRTIVLIITAYEDPERLSEAVRAGASGYLLKTAHPEKIVDAVRRALEGGSPVDEELAMELLSRLAGERPGGQEERARSPVLPDSPPRKRRTPALLRALTPREVQVLRLVVQGHANRQIAEELEISMSTVKKHVLRICAKLGASDRTQAAVMAMELGLVSG